MPMQASLVVPPMNQVGLNRRSDLLDLSIVGWLVDITRSTPKQVKRNLPKMTNSMYPWHFRCLIGSP